jgi:hypothetical protein
VRCVRAHGSVRCAAAHAAAVLIAQIREAPEVAQTDRVADQCDGELDRRAPSCSARRGAGVLDRCGGSGRQLDAGHARQRERQLRRAAAVRATPTIGSLSSQIIARGRPLRSHSFGAAEGFSRCAKVRRARHSVAHLPSGGVMVELLAACAAAYVV